jgi:hypothetical protein
VDDQDVAVSLALDLATHAQTEKTLEEARLVRADDDEVGAALLGQLDDVACRVGEREVEVTFDTPLFEE